jgi:hypothetical protein
MGAELFSSKQMCRRLRTKTMFYQSEPDPSVPPSNDNSFWCTHSMNCMGPDGDVAEPESCRPGRGCFESV